MTASQHLKTAIAALAVLVLTAACDSETPGAQNALSAEELSMGTANQAGDQDAIDYKNGPLSKLGRDLTDLYYAHEAYLMSHDGSAEGFQPANPSMRVVEDMVIIDAVAAESAADLQRDLEAAGMTESATAGGMVSGRLPIAALATVAGLKSLQFARASQPQ